MTSVYNLGCFAGALSTLYSGDKLGRPRTLMLGSCTIALGAIVQAACMNAGMQYAGRVIAGLGTGMNTATAGGHHCVSEIEYGTDSAQVCGSPRPRRCEVVGSSSLVSPELFPMRYHPCSINLAV